MSGQNRVDIKVGARVKIVLKADQPTGKLTEGVVGRLLTNSSFHPHGIKVMLTDGQVGRVQEILE
ncbi:MAG: YwbE family protein [Christensenellaceae bacterium]